MKMWIQLRVPLQNRSFHPRNESAALPTLAHLAQAWDSSGTFCFVQVRPEIQTHQWLCGSFPRGCWVQLESLKVATLCNVCHYCSSHYYGKRLLFQL